MDDVVGQNNAYGESPNVNPDITLTPMPDFLMNIEELPDKSNDRHVSGDNGFIDVFNDGLTLGLDDDNEIPNLEDQIGSYSYDPNSVNDLIEYSHQFQDEDLVNRSKTAMKRGRPQQDPEVSTGRC